VATLLRAECGSLDGLSTAAAFLHGTVVRVAPGFWATELLTGTVQLILSGEFGGWAPALPEAYPPIFSLQ